MLGVGGVMIGSDYHPTHPGVLRAVHEFSQARDVFITFRGNMWITCK